MSIKHLIYRLLMIVALIVPTGAKSQTSYIVNPSGTYFYEDMMRDANLLAKKYPDLIRLDTIGYSVENRTIISMELGTGKHNIFVCATLHAREYIATTFTMNFIDKFAYSAVHHESVGGFNPDQILKNVKFCIVPMINPDGVNLVQNGFYTTEHADTLTHMHFNNNTDPKYICWKSNIDGVDLNKNFDYGWDNLRSDGVPASSGYRGPSPFSEPETQCLVKYMELVSPEAVLSMHTQGRTFYFSTPDSISKSIAQRLRYSTHFTQQRSSSRPYGSFQDYVNHYYNVFYACVELCPHIGPFPYYDNKFEKIWKEAENVFPIVADGVMSKYK